MAALIMAAAFGYLLTYSLFAINPRDNEINR